tara:strand:+ start:107 stop:388 length:282 start_codon:yes stop_codon:yes gene_type:complete
MSTTTFDTLEFVETLKAAKVPEEQAKAHAKAISQITDNTLATKSDLVAVKSDLEKSINTLRLEVKADLKDVVIKLGGIMFLAIGVILAGIKYL